MTMATTETMRQLPILAMDHGDNDDDEYDEDNERLLLPCDEEGKNYLPFVYGPCSGGENTGLDYYRRLTSAKI